MIQYSFIDDTRRRTKSSSSEKHDEDSEEKESDTEERETVGLHHQPALENVDKSRDPNR